VLLLIVCEYGTNEKKEKVFVHLPSDAVVQRKINMCELVESGCGL